MRILSAALLAAMLLALSACGAEEKAPTSELQTTPPVSETTAETTTAAPTDGLPDADMKGWELSVSNYSEKMWAYANIKMTAEEMDGEVLNDALYKRSHDIQERFNCVITVKEDTSPAALIRKNVPAGDSTFDVYGMLEGQLAAFMPNCVSWGDFPYLALDEVWWNPDATSVYNISGRQTALAGSVTLSPVSRAVCMVFNKKILADRGGKTDLYKLAGDGKWTVDSCLDVAKSVSADLNGDGKYDLSDLYGLNFGRGFKGYIASFLSGSDLSFSGTDANGRPAFTLQKNERGIALVQKLLDAMEVKGYCCPQAITVGSFEPADFFSAGHALFTQGVPHDILKLRDMEDDIGVLPMPKYDEAQDKYYSASWGGVVLALPATFNVDSDGDNAGMILEAMAFDGYYDIVPVYKEISLKTKTSRDDESEAMFDLIFDGIRYDFGVNVLYDAVIQQTFLTKLFAAGQRSGVVMSSLEGSMSEITKYTDSVIKIIEEMN